MPAVVKSTVGSFSGINDAPDICLCPLETKKSMYSFLSSFAVISFIFYLFRVNPIHASDKRQENALPSGETHKDALTERFASSSMEMRSESGVGTECSLPSLDTAPAKYLFSVSRPASTS